MNIALIIPSFYPATVYGGPIFSSLHTSEELSKLEDINVFVSTTNANMKSRLDVETNKWIKFKNNFFIKYYNETKINFISLSLLFNLWKDIKQADIVHIQYIFNTTTPIALLYATLFKKPIVLSPRGALCNWCLKQGSKFKKLWLYLFIKPFITRIHWHTTAQQEKEEVLIQFPKAKISIVPNGIELDKFQFSNKLSKEEFSIKFAKQKLNIDKIIVSMGRLQKKKGFDILIDSFNKLLKMYPHAKLFIAGEDESEGDTLRKQIENLNLKEKVFLIGSIHEQEKIDFLSNADIFVLPSHNENFGNVYIESLAVGTPIVASRGTPWSEVETYKCGKWVNNSIKETTKAMLELLEEDTELMKINSMKLSEKYDWKYIALKFQLLFKEEIDEHSKIK